MEGKTAVHVAVEEAYTHILKVLLEFNPNLELEVCHVLGCIILAVMGIDVCVFSFFANRMVKVKSHCTPVHSSTYYDLLITNVDTVFMHY